MQSDNQIKELNSLSFMCFAAALYLEIALLTRALCKLYCICSLGTVEVSFIAEKCLKNLPNCAITKL